MLLPKFDILNKIKKERTITLANAIIIAFAAFVVYTNLKVYHFLIKKCTTPNRLRRYA